MTLGIISIVVGFLIIVTIIISWSLSNHRSFVFCVLACLCLWYGVVLFYAAQMISGWPAPVILPQEAYIQSFIIDEPVYIYFWLQGRDEPPRAFKIDYDRELHKRLTEGKEEAKKNGGRMLLKNLFGKRGQKKRKGNSKNNYQDDVRIEITNPAEQLRKD